MPKSCTLKKTSKQTETKNLMPIEWFKVEYQPSTRHIKDPQVRKNTMTVRISHIVHADQLDQVMENLKKEKLRHINATPLVIDIPLVCPDCGKEGDPIIVENRRAKDRIRDFDGNMIRETKPERWLRYNHKDGKHHRIGKYSMVRTRITSRTIREIPCIKIKKGLEQDCLSISKRVTHTLSNGIPYPLK